MDIAGYLPLTLCDFPGRVAAIVFTQGCNFRCPWCHNRHLLPWAGANTNLMDTAEILRLLRQRRALLEGVVVSGGEPTLQPDLSQFLMELKGIGLATKLDTNGSHPEILSDLLARGLLDFIAMDIKAPWSKYAKLIGLSSCDIDAIRESMGVIARSGVAHQFRTTRVDTLLTPDDYEDIERMIPADSPHLWQEYREGDGVDG